MKKLLCFLIAVFAATVIPAQEQGSVLTYEEALQTAVSKSYSVQLKQAALLKASAQLRSAKAGTDITVGADMTYGKDHAPYDDDPYYAKSLQLDEVVRDQITSSVWAQKAFAFGLQSKLSFDVTRSYSAYKGSSVTETYYEKTYGTKHSNAGTVKLALSLPLFKSFSAAVAANNIRAAEEAYRQMEYELTDTVCQTLLSASSAYWAYLTAHSSMLQLEDMQRILKERSNSMDRLIQAGIHSRHELLSMQVKEIENDRNVIAARVEYERARLELLQALGSDATMLPEPDYTFPDFDFASLQLPEADRMDETFMARIYSLRPDIQALEKQLASAVAAARAAEANTRPDAAINFSNGSTGAVYGDSFDDYLNSFSKNVHGSNVSGGISFSMSIPNNAHRGSVESAQASCRQAEIQLAQAKNMLSMQLANTVSQLHAYRNQVVQANDALSLQKQLYANEQRRFESGLITVEDMFNQDSKYLDAQVQYYKVMITYLQSVLQYKYYTGTLVGLVEGERSELIKENLYKLDTAAK